MDNNKRSKKKNDEKKKRKTKRLNLKSLDFQQWEFPRGL